MDEREVEREIMMYLPAVANWIDKGEDITEADVKHLSDAVPEHLSFGLNISFEELVRFNERFIDDPTWKQYLEILLSDRGKSWLKRNMNLLKKFSLKQ